MLTNKLVNPTHKDVRIKYHRGVVLAIPADSQIDLDMGQMEDYIPGKPGSEETRKQLEYYGLFLLDGDRSFDEQAATSLAASIKEKDSQIRDFKNRIRDNRIATGSPIDDESMSEIMRRSGYTNIEEDVKKLHLRLDILKKELEKTGPQGHVREAFDPTRTCFAGDTPREFPSVSALNLFLSDKPQEFVKIHEDMQKAILGEA